ncbi:MAG TPA: DUF4034 domain-containing protein [Pyrinomonadaceae bacterium]|nr:DUF4034 domain-containing protein [Pyrinomonadaceae bacterium]
MKKNPDGSTFAGSSQNQQKRKEFAPEFDPNSPSDVFSKQINDLFMARDYKAIEKIADEARTKKERMSGGYWKIDDLYEPLSTIYADRPAQELSDELWKNRIELLKQWKQAEPESITARIALSQAYINYAWFARGNGYANTVSKESNELLQERLELAENELKEARQLKAKCPRWYRNVLFLGMARGMEKERFEKIYEEAINSEPNYLQYYLVKSEYLTPKWHGEPGDWQKFVDALPSKIATLKTDESDLIYFVVVVNKLKDNSMMQNWGAISKEKMRKGLADMETKYGADKLRLNQYAFYTCIVRDIENGKDTFAKIGDNFDKSVWNEQQFRQMKQQMTNAVEKIAQNR